jgi:hypothetical protein
VVLKAWLRDRGLVTGKRRKRRERDGSE